MIRETFAAAGDIIRGIFVIVRDPRAIVLSLLPACIGIVAFISVAGLLFNWRSEFAAGIWSPSSEWLMTVWSWTAFLIGLFFSALIAYVIMLILGGVFLELLVERFLALEGIAVSQSFSLLHLLRSTWHSSLRALLFTFVIILTIVCAAVPPLLLVGLLLNAFVLGANLIDLPLALLRVSLRERLRFPLLNLSAVLPLGTMYALLAAVPLLGMVLVGPAHYAAVRQVVRRGEGLRSLRPELSPPV